MSSLVAGVVTERAVPHAARRRRRRRGAGGVGGRSERCSSRSTALPRRTLLRGLGASLALPLLDAMVPAATAAGADAGAPAVAARLRLPARTAWRATSPASTTGRRPARARLRAVADPGAARAVPRSHGRRERPRPASGRRLRRRRQRRSHARHELVAHRRAPQAHRRRRRAQRHLGRSDCGRRRSAPTRRCRRSSWPSISTSSPASARTATAAPTSTRWRGDRRPRRCRPRTIRGSSSSGCSAMAARRRSAWRRRARTAACSIR